MSPQQHEHQFDRISDSVMRRTMEGRISFWNHSAEELYGWRKEEAIGRISHDLLRTQFPRPLQEIESELVRNGRWEGSLVHTTRDGARVVVASQWTLDLDEQSGAVVEINARATDLEIDPEQQKDIPSAIASQQAAPKNQVMKPDDLLAKIANIVLAGAAFLCLLISFYFIYYYGWTAERHFNSAVGTILYCLFPAMLASVLFALLRWSRERRVNAALCCLSIGISVYAGEVLLTFLPSSVFPPGPIWGSHITTAKEKREITELARQFGAHFDTRSKLDVITDLRKGGIDAVPAIASTQFLSEQNDGTLRSHITINRTEVLPLSGIADKLTVFCNETGEYAIYQSDEHGFRNPRGLWQANHVDVAAVGDSLTQGACVRFDENFVSLIRERRPATLNLGMAGEGPLFMLATLKEYLTSLRPKIVLWFYFEGNDPWDLKIEKKSHLLRRYLEENFKQGLLDRRTELDQTLIEYVKIEAAKEALKQKEEAVSDDEFAFGAGTIVEITKLSKLRQKLGLVYGGTSRQQSFEFEESDIPLFRDILLEARRSVSTWGGQLYFVYLPAWERYGEPEFPNETRESVLMLVRKVDIPIIDLHPAFKAQGDPLSLFPFRRFGHYGKEGNRLVAQTVLQSIQLEGQEATGTN